MRYGFRLRLTSAIFLCTQIVHAQYIEKPQDQPEESRLFNAGIVWRDFEPLRSNSQPDSSAIRYRRIMPVIGFRQGILDIQFGYTRFPFDGEEKTSVFFGATVVSEFPVAGRRPSALFLPLMISANFMKAEAGGPSRDNFNVASIGLGLGLTYRFAGRGVDGFVAIATAAQYATEEFRVGTTGFSGSATAECAVMLSSLGIGNGICVGYRFRFQAWSMSDPLYNYRSLAHGPYLGIEF